MPLEQSDLIAIKGIVNDPLESKLSFELAPMKKDIADMKKDISEMKIDVSLLAKLNQLDEIRKEPRLRTITETTN